jgi:hypothetical protein
VFFVKRLSLFVLFYIIVQLSHGLVICHVVVLFSGKVECALFGSYIDLLLKLMGKSANGMPVVVLQFVKVKIF